LTTSLEGSEGFSVTPWPLFTPGKDISPIVHEAVFASGPVKTGTENFAATRIRFANRLWGRNQVVIRTFSPRGTTY